MSWLAALCNTRKDKDTVVFRNRTFFLPKLICFSPRPGHSSIPLSCSISSEVDLPPLCICSLHCACLLHSRCFYNKDARSFLMTSRETCLPICYFSVTQIIIIQAYGLRDRVPTFPVRANSTRSVNLQGYPVRSFIFQILLGAYSSQLWV